MINNGRLRNRITILEKCKKSTDIGSKMVWKVLKTVYAEIRPLRGKEYLESVALENQVSYKITIRYMSVITPKHYVNYQGKYFDIVSVIDVNNRHESMELMCNEHVGNDIEVISG